MAVYEVPGVEESDGDTSNRTIPAGVYPAEITSSRFKTIEKEGSDYKGAVMLLLTFKVEGDDFSVTASDSIILPFPAAMDSEQIRKAKAKIKKLQIATNLEDMGGAIDDEAFMHQELQVEVYEKDDKEYGMQNKVKDYLPA